jgi:hypothetical protein
MKYLCLVYHDERGPNARPDLPGTFVDELLEYQETLRQGGYHIAASPLQPVETATTIRVRNGAVAISDGPATSAPEHLDGFYLIDARDLNDAIRVAARMPPARYGSVEVRPLKEICPPNRSACRLPAAPDDY